MTALVRSIALPLVVLGIATLIQLNGGIGVPIPSKAEPFTDRVKFALLIAFKRYQYASLTILEAIRVALGFSQPLVAFPCAERSSLYLHQLGSYS